MRALLLSAVMLTALSGAAFAETAPANNPAPAAKPEKKKADEGLVCRRERVIGSNRAVKVCSTALQRDLDKTEANRLFNDQTPPQTVDVSEPPK